MIKKYIRKYNNMFVRNGIVSGGGAFVKVAICPGGLCLEGGFCLGGLLSKEIVSVGWFLSRWPSIQGDCVQG